jgi:hypothetical protein
MDLDAALLGDQFACVEQHDDDQHEAVGALQRLQHLRGHRMDCGVVQGLRENRAGDEVRDREQQHDDERNAAQDAERIEPQLAQKLGNTRGWSEGRRDFRRLSDGRGRRSDRLRRRCQDVLSTPAARCAAALGLEQCETRSEQRQRDPGPKRAVGQQVARDRRQFGVALFGRPVTDRTTEGAQAQRLGQRGDPDIVQIPQQHCADAVENEEAEYADIHPEDAAGDDRQQRQQRGGEQQIWQHDDRERPRIRI